jgi:AcrR family transcriptional regulator
VSSAWYARLMARLTRDRILRTAVALADRDGFDAVTLRRVASELHVHVTSLYNHVPTRDAVTDGIVELLIDEAKLPTIAVGWERWVRHFFNAIGSLATTHPGAFTALQLRPVQGPTASTSFEVALEAFVRAGFDTQDAYNAIKATSLTAIAVGMEKAASVQGSTAETTLDTLPPDQFPQMHRLRDLADPETSWSFSLETLVSGLRSQLRRRRSKPRPA